MPKICLGHVKYRDGHATIGVYRLEGDAPFGYDEMKKWIMEDDSEVVKVSISKIPQHLKEQLKDYMGR